MDDGNQPGGHLALALTAGGLFLVSVVCIPLSLLFGMATVFLFDAPGSERSPLTYMLGAGLLLAPVVFCLTATKARSASQFLNRKMLSQAASYFLGWLAYMALTLGSMEVFCGGSFACPV